MKKIMFLKKIDTTLEYHVAHSNPHMLFEKMVELGFASSNSDAFEKCWNSLMKTETGTNYLYELNDFLYHCCQHFAPQIKKMETVKVLNIDIQNMTRQELLENLKKGVLVTLLILII